MMKADIKKKWVAALISGKYKQAGGYLERLGEHKGFCCLGVLCYLAHLAGVVDRVVNKSNTVAIYGASKNNGLLPIEVTGWAGLNSDDPAVLVIPDDSYGVEFSLGLAKINDGGESFETIAKLIEDQL